MSEQPWIERFWAKVVVPTEPNACWDWRGAHNTGGYGTFRIEDRTYLAHRLSWGLSTRTDPGDLCVCHRCDNPTCVRPDHLFIGTLLDNIADRERKKRGRWPGLRGTDNPISKLTEEQVRDMRALQANGASYTELAERFGVTRMVAWRICKRRSWAHVA